VEAAGSRSGAICYDPKIIKGPNTFHIQTISAIFPAPPVSTTPGKVSTIYTVQSTTKKAGPWLTLPWVVVKSKAVNSGGSAPILPMENPEGLKKISPAFPHYA
jgi:hypothetical protein